MHSSSSVIFRHEKLQSLSFADFKDMREKGELCDLSITVQNHTFAAHRVIIAAVIPFFRSLFTSEEKCREEKEISLGDLDPIALESLIDFVYSNQINISDENVHSLLITSHFLQLDHVSDACVEYLSQRLHVSNVVKVRTTAMKIKNAKLIESTSDCIRKNFEEISKSEEFLTLSKQCLKEIISEDELHVSREEIVFEAIMKWVRFSPSSRSSALPELLHEVRVIYLSQDFLMYRVLHDELIAASKDCVKLIEKSVAYHRSGKNGESLNKKPRKIDGIYAVCYSYKTGVSVYYADYSNNTWHHLASEMKYDVVYHVAAVKEKIYLFLEESITTFCPRTLELEELPPKHEFLCGAVVSSHDNVIYFFGSFHHNFRDKQRFFDTKQNRWLQEERMKIVRCNSAAATVGSSIYVTGGWHFRMFGRKRKLSLSRKLSSGTMNVEKYNTLTRQWSVIPLMLTRRERHGSVGFNDKVYVCGGYNAITDCYVLSAEVYDPLIRQWKFIAKMSKERSPVSPVLRRGKILAFGNKNEEDPTVTEIYNPDTDEWEFGFYGLEGFRRAVSISPSSN